MPGHRLRSNVSRLKKYKKSNEAKTQNMIKSWPDNSGKSGREYQQWEDWAMFDEMNHRQARKRRLHVEVRIGSCPATSSSSTMSCSLQGWNGSQEMQLNLRIEKQVDVDATLDHQICSPPPGQGSSEADTVLVHPNQSNRVEPLEAGEEGTTSTCLDQEVNDHGSSQQARVNEDTAETVVEPDASNAETLPVLPGDGDEGSTTVPWGEAGVDSLDPVTLAEIDAFAQQLELEYQAMEQHQPGQCLGDRGFENFLVKKAEGFVPDKIPPDPEDKRSNKEYQKGGPSQEDK